MSKTHERGVFFQLRDKFFLFNQGFRKCICLLILVLSINSLTSCGGAETPPSPSPVARKTEGPDRTPAKDKQTQDVIAKVVSLESKEASPEEYAPKGVRDPFRPVLVPNKAKQQTRNIPLTPLQSYETESLKVVGIIWGELGTRALIQTPDGKEYFAKTGTFVGRNMGRVIEINDSSVVIEEKIINILGAEAIRKVSLELRREKEEG